MTEQRPARVNGLESHEVEDGLVVYQIATDRVHYLNAVASVVFELCTGQHTEAEIEDLVAEAWGLPQAPHVEVRECLEMFRAKGMVR
jgi:hypothetical protein